MDLQVNPGTAGPVARIVLFLVPGIVAIPLVVAMLWDFPLHEAFILVGSILVFQPVAAGTGIALCIPPGPVFLIMLPVGPAAFFIFFGICDLFSRKSAWLRDHLAKVIMVADRPAPPKKTGSLHSYRSSGCRAWAATAACCPHGSLAGWRLRGHCHHPCQMDAGLSPCCCSGPRQREVVT